MPDRRTNHNSDWNTSPVNKNTLLYSLFPSICRVFACFFEPAIGALCSDAQEGDHPRLDAC